ncbi:hypothetical protein [Streptomyces alboflavus]|uniref:hypothetical protein n=1 Tax=Streptomyces alboflavus TaxID=67267 RepID=UPI0036CCEE26
MTAAEPLLPTPDAGLLARVGVTTWLENTPLGCVAFLLIVPPPSLDNESRSVSELRMRGLGAALGLAPTSQVLPDIGPRLRMQGQTAVVVEIDQCDYQLRVPVGTSEWARFVAEGGPVAVALGLDELRRGTDHGGVERYLARTTEAERLLMGKTAVRRPSVQRPLAAEGGER